MTTRQVQRHLGLSRYETGFQEFRRLLVVLLAGASYQRVISGILDQRVLEDVPRARRPAALVKQLGIDQLGQSLLQCCLLDRTDGLHHLVGELPSQHGAELGHLTYARQPVHPRSATLSRD